MAADEVPTGAVLANDPTAAPPATSIGAGTLTMGLQYGSAGRPRQRYALA